MLGRVIDSSKDDEVKWNSGSLWPLISYTNLGKVFHICRSQQKGCNCPHFTGFVWKLLVSLPVKCFPTYLARLQVIHTQVWCGFRRHNSTFVWVAIRLKPVSVLWGSGPCSLLLLVFQISAQGLAHVLLKTCAEFMKLLLLSRTEKSDCIYFFILLILVIITFLAKKKGKGNKEKQQRLI